MEKTDSVFSIKPSIPLKDGMREQIPVPHKNHHLVSMPFLASVPFLALLRIGDKENIDQKTVSNTIDSFRKNGTDAKIPIEPNLYDGQ